MFCSKCGNKNDVTSKFCVNCGEVIQNTDAAKASPNNNEGKNQPPVNQNNDPTKIFRVLSYISILWIVGLLCEQKNDENVKFHVGQGIILTIATTVLGVAGSLINSLIIYNVFTTEEIWFGIATGIRTVSATGFFIGGMISLAIGIFSLFLIIKGIINAVNNKNEKLPLIGNWAFYK